MKKKRRQPAARIASHGKNGADPAAPYKALGFVNTREMLAKAYREGYAVGAFNFVALEQLLAITTACIETRSPFILQASANVRAYLSPPVVKHMALACLELIRESGTRLPVALHLDHGLSFEECAESIEDGFSSVMIDGSALAYEQNVALTARVVEHAHRCDVTVEGELGTLSGIEEGVGHGESRYTDPAAVQDFVRRTGVDSLAISIGTSHGVAKIKVRPGEPVPPLRFDILDEVARRLPGFPIVLHGCSSIEAKFVDMINAHGGNIRGAQGIPPDQARRAAQAAVCKINIASDGWIAMTAAVRTALAENASTIDPRKFLAPARDAMRAVYVRKNSEVLGSAGKA